MLLALLATIAASNGDAMAHVGLTPEDRFVQCARGVFGKPILLDAWSPWPGEAIACPAPRTTLVEALKARGIPAFDAAGWVHLVSTKWFEAPTARAEWKQLRVTQTIKEWGKGGSRSLTHAEQQQIAVAILEHARPPIAYTPRGRDSSGRIADTIDLLLYLDAHTFGPPSAKRKESVVAVWGVDFGPRRVIYGEIEDGVYRPLWDSPHVPGAWLMMGYRDVDGDGTEEIILQSRYGGAGRDLLLVIFDSKGREITRQDDDCEKWLTEKRPDVTCPIGGQLEGLVEYEERKDGKTDILVYQLDQEVRYRLVGGHYMREKPRPTGSQSRK
jgi:hypothetical protein